MGGGGDLTIARFCDHREKEKAMHDRLLERMEGKLKKLQASAESGRLKDQAVGHQWLGRIKERY
ncbi:MAG: hypothetical protein HY287_07440 [Planctomycetes bacterium]|nr:hypothetical protein [Planctomycetota bacterium]MBI3834146.1 hypothetical protein [Planctomycetota bacterium]